MPKLYVTKWVIARGILVIEGSEIYTPDSGFRPRSHPVKSDGHRWWSPLTIGKDAFLTLEEAKADARLRFKARLEKARQEMNRATRDWACLKRGILQVHVEPTKVSDCSAFTLDSSGT